MTKITDLKGASKLKSYRYWVAMHNRCKNGRDEVQPQYSGVTVCEEWKLFSNFDAWFDNNYIEGYQLDKDLLVHGNKLYSPDTCVFIPGELNRAITKLHPSNIRTLGTHVSSHSYSEKIRYGGCRTKDDANRKHLLNKINRIRQVMGNYTLPGNVKAACNGLIGIISDIVNDVN